MHSCPTKKRNTLSIRESVLTEVRLHLSMLASAGPGLRSPMRGAHHTFSLLPCLLLPPPPAGLTKAEEGTGEGRRQRQPRRLRQSSAASRPPTRPASSTASHLGMLRAPWRDGVVVTHGGREPTAAPTLSSPVISALFRRSSLHVPPRSRSGSKP